MPDLNQQVGPLPLWGWGVALVGGVGLAIVGRRSGITGSKTATPAAGTFEPDLPAYDPRGAVVIRGGTMFDPEPAAPSTNSEWRRKATTRLVSEGMGALAVDQALGRYLAGQPLDAAQRNIVDRALATFGPPPDGAPISPPTVPPDDTPGVEPKTVAQLTKARLLHHGAAAHRDITAPTRFGMVQTAREWIRRGYSVNDPALNQHPRFKRGVALAGLAAGGRPA